MEKKFYRITIDTEIGELLIGECNNTIFLLDYKNRKKRDSIDSKILKELSAEVYSENTDLLKEAEEQINNYLKGTIQEFNLPFSAIGSEFQKTVLQELQNIPYGKTVSYKDIAEKIKMPTAIRAVANAIASNHLNLIIPCHRVIGANNKLTGYAGGITAKKKLLKLESNSSHIFKD